MSKAKQALWMREYRKRKNKSVIPKPSNSVIPNHDGRLDIIPQLPSFKQ